MKWIVRTGLAAMALLLFMFRNAHTQKLERQTIKLKANKPFKPFEMLFISDLHRRKIPEKLIDFEVDIIVIGGDLAEKDVPLDRIEHNLRLLKKSAPVYFVWGNNDREVGEDQLRDILKRTGVQTLENESVELFGEEKLKLVAIDYFAYKTNAMENTFADVQADDTVIFVSHTPFVFKRVKEKYPVDFMLAGHTHGGQIRFGKFGIYEKGEYIDQDGVKELISNGFGTTQLPLRLGAEAQYHLFSIGPDISEDERSE